MLLFPLALTLGFLHGLGPDHLMAIAALSVGFPADASRRPPAFQVALRFACGHALLLGIGAVAVVFLGWNVPLILETAGETVAGALLVLLGGLGMWAVCTGRVYAHAHTHGSDRHDHWHLHIGRPDRHPLPAAHRHLPGFLGAVFAISGLRALTMVRPSGEVSALMLLASIVVFGIGILLSMSLFGIILARVLSLRAIGITSRLAASVTALTSIVLGACWVL